MIATKAIATARTSRLRGRASELKDERLNCPGSAFKRFCPIGYHWIALYDASYLLLSHAVCLAIAAHRYNKYSRTRTGYNLDLCSWHKEQSCVARVNYFSDFLDGGPAGRNCSGQDSRLWAQNGLVERFRYRRGQRAGQREKCARSKRLPQFLIRAYSGRIRRRENSIDCEASLES